MNKVIALQSLGDVKLCYQAIGQVGIVIAAALGIDLMGVINNNPDFQLRKLNQGCSKDSSSSSLNLNHRKVNVGDSNSIIYGTYRKKNTDPTSQQIIIS